jgi:hypothetical protein
VAYFDWGAVHTDPFGLRDYLENKNIVVAQLNYNLTDSHDWIGEMREIREEFGQNKQGLYRVKDGKEQYWRIAYSGVIRPAAKSGNPADLSLSKLQTLVEQYLDKEWTGFQVKVYYHQNVEKNKAGKIIRTLPGYHAHFVVNNCDMILGKKFKSTSIKHENARMHKVINTLCKELGMTSHLGLDEKEFIEAPDENHTWADVEQSKKAHQAKKNMRVYMDRQELEMLSRGTKSQKQLLREAIANAAVTTSTVEEFEQKLKLAGYGIHTNRRGQYVFTSNEACRRDKTTGALKPLEIKAEKLGQLFVRDYLIELLPGHDNYIPRPEGGKRAHLTFYDDIRYRSPYAQTIAGMKKIPISDTQKQIEALTVIKTYSIKSMAHFDIVAFEAQTKTQSAADRLNEAIKAKYTLPIIEAQDTLKAAKDETVKILEAHFVTSEVLGLTEYMPSTTKRSSLSARTGRAEQNERIAPIPPSKAAKTISQRKYGIKLKDIGIQLPDFKDEWRVMETIEREARARAAGRAPLDLLNIETDRERTTRHHPAQQQRQIPADIEKVGQERT